jgi:hypothetical protein
VVRGPESRPEVGLQRARMGEGGERRLSPDGDQVPRAAGGSTQVGRFVLLNLRDLIRARLGAPEAKDEHARG